MTTWRDAEPPGVVSAERLLTANPDTRANGCEDFTTGRVSGQARTRPASRPESTMATSGEFWTLTA